jgi:hypothetical protein
VAEFVGDRVQLFGDGGGVGLGEDVRMAAATISAEPFGTLARTLRRK